MYPQARVTSRRAVCDSGRSRLVGTGINLGNIGRLLAAVVVVGVAVTGCTPAAAPLPSPSPPVSQTPTESSEQRQQRLDYEAAEKSYRAFRAEYNRVLRAGGAKEPTPVMKANAGNGYLTEVQKVAEAYKGLGYHQVGTEEIVSIKRGGHSPMSLVIDACEDTRNVHTEDRKGKNLGSGEIRLVKIKVRTTGGIWRLWSGNGKKADSCD